jgi:acetyltransferase AlgX (SGNH hydrolase-like protein)
MWRRIVPAAWLLALLSIPAISLALGVRQPLMDNRSKTSWPSMRAANLVKAKTYKQLDAAWRERVPTRKQSVQAHSELSVGVFGESPNSSVSVGRDGWFYYNEALQPCREQKPIADPADTAEILTRTIIASGRRALLIEPADKMFIVPSRAPRYPRAVTRCVTALQRKVTARLRKIPGGVDFDAELQRMEAAGQSTFLPHDSHWNYRGRLAYARLILDFIAPGLSRRTGLHLGPWYAHHSDLYRQLGLPKTDRDRAVLLRRAAPQPVPTGPTLLIGDSQTIDTFRVPPTPGVSPISKQLPQGTVVCTHVEEVLPGTCDDAIRRASAIAVESVGRNMYVLEATCWRVLTVIAQGAPGLRSRYELLGGAASRYNGRMTFGSDGQAALRIVPATGDVSQEPRLLAIPVDALPPDTAIGMEQRPVRGLPTPCSTPLVTQTGYRLIVPIPARRDASEIVLHLTASPGTTLGAPLEVPLQDPRAGAVRRR